MNHVNLKQRTRRVLQRSLLAALFLTHAWPVLAVEMPALTHLEPISQQLKAPAAVTPDVGGRVYVAETGSTLVRIYSRGGSLLHTITASGQPVSLAVDANGWIYLGNGTQGSVEVFDNTGRYLFALGQGTGEFGRPSDIDIDAAGLIYVVDKTNCIVRVFNPDGTSNATIGQPGNGNGQFHHPVSLAIDAENNELVVLDRQECPDGFTDKMIDGARIQFLEMDGTFKRGYTKFGYERDSGQLVIPKQVAVDGESRVYVSDSRLQKVMVYDNNGVFLGMIDDAAKPFLTPLGISLGRSNKLYAASLRAGKIEVYGLDDYIDMNVGPSALGFEELEGEPSGALQGIVVNNTGNSMFTWTANTAEPWLTLPAIGGTINSGGQATVQVGVDIDGLAPGQYRGSVTISAGGAASETVAVTLTVLPNAILLVSPDSLHFVATAGSTPAAQYLAIGNGGSSALNWNANVDQSWLVLDATSGTAPASIKVYADVTSFAAGSYSGTVTVTSQGSPSEMKVIPVTLTLAEPAGPPVIPPPVTNPGITPRQLEWTTRQVLPGTSLNGIWGEANSDLYVVGDKGIILRYDGKNWFSMESDGAASLFGIWGSSANDVYAVGKNGVALHYDGNSWSPLPQVVEETLRDIWGSSASDVFAVSRNGSILESFSAVTAAGVALRGIWGSSAPDVFAVGENGAILHYDGNGWTPMGSGTTSWLNGVWGSSSEDVFAVGENGAIVHYDGTSWNCMDSGTTVTLRSVWGSSGSDVFAVGAEGVILHYNGHGWYSVTTGTTEGLHDVWVSGRSEVFAVGENGTVVIGRGKFPWMQFIRHVILPNAKNTNPPANEEEELQKQMVRPILEQQVRQAGLKD